MFMVIAEESQNGKVVNEGKELNVIKMAGPKKIPDDVESVALTRRYTEYLSKQKDLFKSMLRGGHFPKTKIENLTAIVTAVSNDFKQFDQDALDAVKIDKNNSVKQFITNLSEIYFKFWDTMIGDSEAGSWHFTALATKVAPLIASCIPDKAQSAAFIAKVKKCHAIYQAPPLLSCHQTTINSLKLIEHWTQKAEAGNEAKVDLSKPENRKRLRMQLRQVFNIVRYKIYI